MAISITPSPFGSVTVTLDGELGGVLSVGVLATSNSALNMDLGVPGPAGEAGEPGSNGQGVAPGGLINQVLVKLSNDDFDTGWADGGAGGDYLPLSGGTMSGDIAFSVDGNGNDLLIGSWGLGVENTDGHVLYLQPDVFRIYDNDHTTGTSVNGEGITFNDSTIQWTAYDPAVLGNYLPLTGGQVAGNVTFKYTDPDPETGYTNSIEINPEQFNISFQGPNYNSEFSPAGISLNQGATNLSFGFYYNGIRFTDATIQTTAGLPLTGGTMTGESPTIEVPFYDRYIRLNAETGLELNKVNIYLTETDGFGSSITFPDSSVQTTAFLGYTGTTSDYIRGNGSTAPFPAIPVFPPSGGTTSQYIRGDGSVATYGPLGDRYFTTSNSTLTCDSGNGKTMTIGTGLSYSRQQDITVSYNNANHMHGTVLTYDSTTGVMTFDSNTHSGGGTYSSWEVNVGGVAGAVLPVGGTSGQVLAKINSTNFNTEWLSLGTMSTEPASAYLSTASAVANYQTISGMSAYLSTSAAASTYQTQSGMSAYLSTSAASANFIGTSAYATTAQAQAGTSTTTVVSPATLLDAKWFAGGKGLNVNAWTGATSGVGSVASANSMNARIVSAPTSATGYGESYGAIVNTSRGGAYNSGIDWSKRVVFGGRFSRNVTSPDTNSVFRYTLGRFASPIPSDILATDKQVGIKVSGTSAMQLMCANGSALATVTSSFTPSNASAFDVVVTSDGAGNVALYVNGSSVATSTGGPTSTQGAFYNNVTFEAQNTSTISGGAMSVLGTDFFAQVNA